MDPSSLAALIEEADLLRKQATEARSEAEEARIEAERLENLLALKESTISNLKAHQRSEIERLDESVTAHKAEIERVTGEMEEAEKEYMRVGEAAKEARQEGRQAVLKVRLREMMRLKEKMSSGEKSLAGVMERLTLLEKVRDEKRKDVLEWKEMNSSGEDVWDVAKRLDEVGADQEEV